MPSVAREYGMSETLEAELRKHADRLDQEEGYQRFRQKLVEKLGPRPAVKSAKKKA